MRKLIRFKIHLLLCIILVQSTIYAQNERRKTISKQYKVSPNTRLDISNIYGNIDVKTWEKDQIKVDVTIITKGNRAEEMIKKIHIEHDQSDSEISFETEINSTNTHQGSCKIQVNYVVNMPIKNPLEIYNKYGHVFLDDFQGELDMTVRYGKLKANQLTSSHEKEITVAYGGLDIDELENGEINISYSQGEIEKSDNIDLNNRYSTMRFGTIKTLNTDMKYGKLFIYEKAHTVKGEISYSRFSVAELLKKLNIEARYTNRFDVSEVSKEFEKINITGSYSTLNLTFAKKADFNFEIGTKYGGFNNSISNRTNLIKDTQKGQYSHFEGKVGKGNKGHVHINVNYGSVRFR